jgi:hypothetical protein
MSQLIPVCLGDFRPHFFLMPVKCLEMVELIEINKCLVVYKIIHKENTLNPHPTGFCCHTPFVVFPQQILSLQNHCCITIEREGQQRSGSLKTAFLHLKWGGWNEQ